jgi:hypothetical protein
VNGDKITVFGATEDTVLAEQTLTLIDDQFPNKKSPQFMLPILTKIKLMVLKSLWIWV